MRQLKTVQRWDLVGMSLIALLGIVLVFLLDTGSVAEWIARHKHTKIDEIVFTALALLIVLWLFLTRKLWDLSRLVTRYESLSFNLLTANLLPAYRPSRALRIRPTPSRIAPR